MVNCSLCEELADSNHPTLILDTPPWRVVLSHYQSYAGRLFIMLRQHKASLSELSQEEWKDFTTLVPLLENANRTTLGGSPFNWLSMMNDSYKNDPPNPHVHWHMIPRYDHDVVVADHTFTDPEFAHHYDASRQQKISPEVTQALIEKIKHGLEDARRPTFP